MHSTAGLNDSFKVLNLLLDRGISVRRARPPCGRRSAAQETSSYGRPRGLLTAVARRQAWTSRRSKETIKQASHPVRRLRAWNVPAVPGAGTWTRDGPAGCSSILSFPYHVLMDAGDRRRASLNEQVRRHLPRTIRTVTITGGSGPEKPETARRSRWTSTPGNRSGIGKEGGRPPKTFVEKGGTLVALGDATDFAIEKLKLSVRNVVSKKTTREFFCPGSTLKVRFANNNPLAYGMPAEGLVLFFDSPAFEIVPGGFNDRYETVVRYADRDLLQSGWLIGGENLVKKSGMLSARCGEGKAVLIGFRAQHRAQTHGTFKLFFNALVR